MPARDKRKGFTLIELSIVLVIIGLIVGGVMVGRDLIEGARIRAQIGQFQEYQIAINGFRLKYNCLPGDCAEASNLSLGTSGNGNGLVQTTTAAYSSFDTPDGVYNGEFPQFFIQLQASGLIKQKLDGLVVGSIRQAGFQRTSCGAATGAITIEAENDVIGLS